MSASYRPVSKPLTVAVLGVIVMLWASWEFWQRLPRRWTTFTRARWSFAPQDAREKLARDYLATHAVLGQELAQVLADLGEPTERWDYWEYPVSFAGLGRPADGVPRHATGEPTLYVWFDAEAWRVTRLTYIGYDAPTQAKPFSVAEWQAYAHFPDQRRPLALSLVEDKLLVGRNSDEILRDLGPPGFAERRLHYRVGESGGEELLLVVRTDENDRVVEARLSDVKPR